jgi:polyphenol oxidase
MTIVTSSSSQPPALLTLRWRLGPVQLAYSTVADGDQRDPLLRQTWQQSLGISRGVVPRQVHGTVVVDASDTQGLPFADGVVSDDPILALGVYGADCPGLCLVAGPVMGVAHCGWRGVAAGIVQQLVNVMCSRTTIPKNEWLGLIGPGISRQNYEVDAPVLSARTWPATAVTPGRTGHAWLDVAQVIADDLAHLGITAITQSPICTATDDRLWSYRQQGPGIVQALMAWRVAT